MKTDALKIVIIEDNFLLAETLADGMRQLGHVIVAMAGTLDQGLMAARGDDFDLAIVDLDLHGVSALPIIDALATKGVPFILASGISSNEIGPRYRDATRVRKPYNLSEIGDAMKQMQPFIYKPAIA